MTMILGPENVLVAAALLAIATIIYVTDADGFENEPAGGSSGDKAKCRKNAKKSLWKQYDWRSRKLKNGKWRCDKGWQDTGCTWTMGKEFETKQCRRKRSDAGKYEESAKTGTMSSDLSLSDNKRKWRRRCMKYSRGEKVDASSMTDAMVAWCKANIKDYKTPAPTPAPAPAPAPTEAPQTGTTTTTTAAAPGCWVSLLARKGGSGFMKKYTCGTWNINPDDFIDGNNPRGVSAYRVLPGVKLTLHDVQGQKKIVTAADGDEFGFGDLDGEWNDKVIRIDVEKL